MKERPILFSAPMVRALLAGTKTQTRRIVKPNVAQCIQYFGGGAEDEPATKDSFQLGRRDDGSLAIWSTEYPEEGGETIVCPYGVPGDRLWVKETHAANVPGCERGLSYRADHNDPKGDGPANPMRWTPSIHMRRAYSRLTLEVTSVRVERVQDISEADARAEGVSPSPFCRSGRASGLEHVDAFEELWRSINGAESWDANPWVWVVGFKVVT